ncbi:MULTISPECIES: hypothetical protein [unclassified Bradyrhizobium]|uniref:hypothetical protein n=1 Tax=unclassified Bradyrhizobium TaxID=2631580 RepID=UPI0020B33FA7|nr:MULTISPECIES: hypothetical protein [unclassified Bradyrhizobium]MCP3385203.1 hypothetical protein [Bradyrhizobium sp. CCGUVB4N]MCP3446467.1 hypothetical protein [Bradyrhizobium sp. CCGUVB14]
MRPLLFVLMPVVLLSFSSSHGQESAQSGPAITLPRVDPNEMKALSDAYPTPNKPDRATFVAPKTQRGTTTIIPEEVVVKFCSGKDGCIVRIGMHNWDDTGRVASRHFLFFYNKETGVWRAEAGDAAGTNKNNVTEHVNNSWACYFTDGRYENWQDKGDTDGNFGLLSWNQYNADCYLTLVN